MPVRIQQHEIWTRLIRRFKIEPGAPSLQKAIDTIIRPISNIDDLLRKAVLSFVSKNLTASGVLITYWTVPANKRWTIIHLVGDATTGSSYLWVGDGITDMKLTAVSASTKFFDPGIKMTLEPGWVLGMGSTGNAADTSVAAFLWYEEEDAY